jgi:hypothetical protein
LGLECPRFICPADDRAWQGNYPFALEAPVNGRFIFGSREARWKRPIWCRLTFYEDEII